MNVHGYKPAKFKLALSTIPALGLLNLSVTKFVAKLPPPNIFCAKRKGGAVWSVRELRTKKYKNIFLFCASYRAS